MRKQTFKKIALAFGAIFAMTIAGCSENNSSDEMTAEYLPAQLQEGDDWCFVGTEGKVFAKDQFEFEPSAVINGVFSAVDSTGISLYKFDKNGSSPIANCSHLYTVGYANEGLIPITRPQSRIEVVDINGKTKFALDPVDSCEIIYSNLAFHDGMLEVQDANSKCGYFNSKGECTIKPQYDYASDFSDGLAYVGNIVNDKYAIKVIDINGNVKFDVKDGYLPILNFRSGKLFVRGESDEIAWYDAKGEFNKCPDAVHNVMQWNDKAYVYVSGNGCGVMDYEGNNIVPDCYMAIQILPDGKFLCSNNQTCTIFSAGGKEETVIDGFHGMVAYLAPVGYFGYYDDVQLLDSKGKSRDDKVFYSFGFRSSVSEYLVNDKPGAMPTNVGGELYFDDEDMDDDSISAEVAE